MSTAARPFPIVPPSDDLPPETMSDLVTERRTLTDRIEVLERNLRSFKERNRALIAARHDMAPPMSVVGTFAKGRTIDAVIAAAHTCEVMGTVPAIRFVRNDAQQITGVELAILSDVAEPIDDGFRTFVALGGMACVRG